MFPDVKIRIISCHLARGYLHLRPLCELSFSSFGARVKALSAADVMADGSDSVAVLEDEHVRDALGFKAR